MINIKTIFWIILLSVISLISSCSKKTETPIVPKTGVEIVAIGPILFGGVVVGDIRDAAVRVINNGPNPLDTSKFSELLVAPFKIQSISNPCNAGSLPANASCIISIRFQPLVAGDVQQEFTIGTSKMLTSGRGLLGGAINISDTSWEPGVAIAGTELRKTITVTNLGDFTIPAPNVQLVPGVTIGIYTCGTFIAAKKDCRVELVVRKLIAQQLSEDIYFDAQDGGKPFITLITNTIPSDPAGNIAFTNPPATIVADGLTIKQITTQPIRDQFGNIVKDGTSVKISSANLTMLTSSPQLTQNGIITFSIQSPTIKGSATVSLLSSEASGFLRIKATSGPAYGTIQAEPYVNQIVANGQTQIIFKLLTLVDQKGNVVEDGTPISYELVGAGTLSKSIGITTLGSDSVVLKSPTTLGSAILKIRSGPIYNENMEIIDWSAKGDFPIEYIPGLAAGTIPIQSNLSGIYAVEDQSYENLGIPIRTSVTIGPVKDLNGNIVVTGTPLTLNITNGINITDGAANPITIFTNTEGKYTFLVAGNGIRGNINIAVSGGAGALGSYNIWAFKDEKIIAKNDGSNKVFIYEKFNSSTIIPSVNSGWASSVNITNTSLTDSTLFGTNFYNRDGARSFFASSLEYFNYPCWFGGNTANIFAGPCLKNNFNNSTAFKILATDETSLFTDGVNTDRTFSQVMPNNYHFPGIGFNPQLDKYLIFGGNYFEPTTLVGHDTKVSAYYSGLTLTGNTATSTNLTGEEDPADIGSYPPAFSPSSVTTKDDKFYMFGGYGAFSDTYYNQLFSYNGSVGKWSILSPDSDPNERYASGEPTVRSQNGIVYSPINNSLYIAGGLRKYLCSEFVKKNSCNSFPECSWNDVEVLGTNFLVADLPNSDLALGEHCDPISCEDISNRYRTTYAGAMITECNKRAGCFWDAAKANSADPTIQSKACSYKSFVTREGGGLTDSNDVWQLDLGNANLQWKKICGSVEPFMLGSETPNIAYQSCGLPSSGIPGQPFSGTPVYSNTDQDNQQSPKNMSMVWNPLRQKIYMFWQDRTEVKVLDPKTNTISDASDGAQTLGGAYQVFYHQYSGQMFGYIRGGINQLNSSLKAWGANGNEKIYYKIEVDLGSGSKYNAQTFTPILKGGGQTSFSTWFSTKSYGIGNKVIYSGVQYSSLVANNSNKRPDQNISTYWKVINEDIIGLELYIYNVDTSSWELVGKNSLDGIQASTISSVNGSPIQKTYDSTVSPISKYISTDGFIKFIVTPKGDPDNASSHKIFIDSFSLEGRF